MTRTQIRPEQRQEIVRQIGRMNLLSISGGRVRPTTDGIELPVSNGFHVRITLTPMDTYTVERVFRRGGKEFIHGRVEDVYCDTLHEIAYRAGMFRSWDAETWPTAGAR